MKIQISLIAYLVFFISFGYAQNCENVTAQINASSNNCTSYNLAIGLDVNYCTPETGSEESWRNLQTLQIAELSYVNNGLDEWPYINHTFTSDPTANLVAGNDYSLSVNAGNDENSTIKVWIDYNKNGVFESEELVAQSDLIPISTTISVPANAINGLTRMRILSIDYEFSPSTPCNAAPYYSQFQDFKVMISGGAAINYNWSTTNGTISNPSASNPTLSGLNRQAFVSLSASYGNCAFDLEHIIAAPIAGFNAQASTTTTCGNEIVTLTSGFSAPANTVYFEEFFNTDPNWEMLDDNSTLLYLTYTVNGSYSPNGSPHLEGGYPDYAQGGVITPAFSLVNSINPIIRFQMLLDGVLDVYATSDNGENWQLLSLLYEGGINWKASLGEFAGLPNVKLKFYVSGYSIGLDNVRVIEDVSPAYSVTWSPAAELYTDNAATIPYAGGNANTVYAKPSVTSTYTATAVSGSCTVSQSVTVNVEAPADNLSLATPADNDIALVPSGCEVNGWTYYRRPGGEGYLIAINWDPSNSGANAQAKAAATPSIHVDDNYHMESNGNYATFTMRRYWNVNLNGTALTSPVNLRFFYLADEKTEIENARNTFVNNHSNSVNDEDFWFKTVGQDFVPSVIVTPQGITNYISLTNANASGNLQDGLLFAQFNGISTFSGGTYSVSATDNTAQPVHLISFTGTKNIDKTNSLTWRIACTDDRPNRIELQRFNITSQTWLVIHSEITNQMTCNQPFYYKDLDPALDVNLYRLRITDADGLVTYSNTVKLENGNGVNISMMPNPAYDYANLHISSPALQNADIKLIGMAGRIILKRTQLLKIGENLIKLDLHSISAGTYNVFIRFNNGTTRSIKLIKK